MTAAKTDAPADPAQEWLAPIKEKFLEARKNGASMAELQRMILMLHPRTKALAEAFAKNILAGLRGEEEEGVATANARENESEDIEAKNIWGCNIKHKCPQKGTTRETKEKNVNSIPKICGPDASQGEIEKALKEGIEWVLKNRKSLYGVCYVKSVNKNGKEELLPLDLHLEDILHANEHNDMAEELWKTISRGEWVIRDSDTDEVYRIGRKKVVLRDYTKNRDMGKRKKLVTHYKDNRDDKPREEKKPSTRLRARSQVTQASTSVYYSGSCELRLASCRPDLHFNAQMLFCKA